MNTINNKSHTLGFSLCHGWAFDKNFLKPLAQQLQGYFPSAVFTFWDLGFSGAAHIPSLDLQRKWIAIGHSYGFAHLMQIPFAWRAAVAINGFTHFCPQPDQVSTRLAFSAQTTRLQGTAKRIVDRMHSRLFSDMPATINDFYQRCGLSSLYNNQVDTDIQQLMRSVLPDISTLVTEPLAHHLLKMRDLALSPPSYRLLALASTDDLIVPKALTVENFGADTICYLAGDHLLALKSTAQCAAKIAEFVKQLNV